MGNCAAKKRRQRIQAELERQAALERAGLAASGSGVAGDLSGLGGAGGLGGGDMDGALSSGYGHGGGGYASYGYVHEEECPEGIDEDLALLLTAAAIAAGAFVIYRQITIQQMGRRRRRADGDGSGGGPVDNGFVATLLLGRCHARSLAQATPFFI